MSDYDVCECGDYRSSHYDGRGACGICKWSNAPWDNCRQFRFAYNRDPIPFRPAVEPAEGTQAR
jgi:hypothetical protein